MSKRIVSILLLAMTGQCGYALAAKTSPYDALSKDYRKVLSELVQVDTTNPPGHEARAVAIIAKILKKEGIPYEITEFAPGRQNIVARLTGTGIEKPLLLLAHLDVVGVKDQKWSTPPHLVTEKDGFLYGRGVFDDLSMAVANLETFLKLKRDGTPLRRDVILALTGDEESGGAGIQYILKHKPEQIDAGIALNECGMPVRDNKTGKIRFVEFESAEKIYQDFTITAYGPTGHSAVPKKGNAIYRLSRALSRLGQYQPEARLIPTTREFFKERSSFEKPALARAMRALANAKGKLPEKALRKVTENPMNQAILTTTCVATTISGGTRVNALPAQASANVNCRILPDETVQQVRQRLIRIFHDRQIEVKLGKDMGAAGPSPVHGEVPSAIRTVAQEMWPGIHVLPTLLPGATDSRFLRLKGVQAYGFNPIAISEEDAARAHGIDERIAVSSIRPGLEFMDRLVTTLAASPQQKL